MPYKGEHQTLTKQSMSQYICPGETCGITMQIKDFRVYATWPFVAPNVLSYIYSSSITTNIHIIMYTQHYDFNLVYKLKLRIN